MWVDQLMSISLICDKLVLIALFTGIENKCKTVAKSSLSNFCLKESGSELVMSLEGKVIEPIRPSPSIGDYLHGWTLTYSSYHGSL